MTEDELVEWPYRLSGHECGQTLGDSEGQGSLVCCSPWSPQESDMTWAAEQQRYHLSYCFVLVFVGLFFLSCFLSREVTLVLKLVWCS